MTEAAIDVFWDERVLARHGLGPLRHRGASAARRAGAPPRERRAHPQHEVRARAWPDRRARALAPGPAGGARRARGRARDGLPAIDRRGAGAAAAASRRPRRCLRVVAALLAAAGTCLEAADAVLEGRSRISYALVRPPGHHAQPAQADGFCFLAHETLVAERARARDRPRRRCRLGRPPRQRHAGVLLSSGGCAHDLAAHGARLLGSVTPSARQRPGPGRVTARASTSTSSSTSAPATPPTPTRSRSVVPIIRQFRPGLIVGACGSDASAFDPNGRQNVSMAGFRRIGQLVGELAEELCEGRLVLVQEGGYGRTYSGYCLHATLEGVLPRAAARPARLRAGRREPRARGDRGDAGRARPSGRSEPCLGRPRDSRR